MPADRASVSDRTACEGCEVCELASELSDERRLCGLYEAEVARLRSAIEEYILWQPGRAGHAAAHKRLREALNGGDDV